ncbi:D-Alanyl-D-Alanine carboxypeptidase [Azotobacter vinelandii CA]|uniref:serine-type D-Ala-D-Ala carboxypeptidase n=2 Tax=Azotobacter vinelandii TaxID=354 RepID=C1DMQ8_AZOVD|nr:D-alanyl-D-alanine carboxypeptidase family protein [Azotobacter vinelandii]ACO77088.1 D-Alanyl-D-Alanine carboxypeptidase [Azotobacter vinelandii DJ]AGK13378.1 D-Alanyl-D-Alanine carboxypeptidase [Azotobacter vinelandii CA]AGK17736.1 D-Alanyl-D-Alanine carboxypeptidase [Azotobacter vinelandii CA6]SFX94413.1 penicillin-binding protein 6. Serine peptidase. MEROPS family S11 [Azotobacter vinelandii]GLK60271.1 D-Ala-D-Ala carboxypeptidase [Azotobacter vinelandii]
MKTTRLVQRLFLALLIGVPSAWAAEPQPQPQPQPTPAPARAAEPQAIPAPPQLASTAYLLMDAASGQVLIESNGEQRLPPASLTKLMTAYIATLEIKRGQIKESDLVTVSERAWRTGGSRMFIQVGTQVSVSDLLHGIIIQSGNDSSVALAEHIAGSEDAFADMMNATAQRLGLSNTHFMNATGLPHAEHYSSAHDMARLARAIIYDDPAHYAIYAQKEFFWNNIKQPNRNLLLWRDKTVDGLKTGHTEEAGYCLVASAVRDGQRLIAVVFGTKSEQARAAETQKLLTYGFRFFETQTFFQKNVELARSPVWKGASNEVRIGLAEDLTLTMPRGQLKQLTTTSAFEPQLIAPIQQGAVVGKVEVRLGEQVLRSADLVALDAVEEGGLFRRLWDSIRLFFYSLFN